jgi:glucose/arabinose dehydrogenase
MAESEGANSGIFVRFPEQSDDPWYAVNNGYEIQIDDRADPLHATGAVYTFSPAAQNASRGAGEWNHYRIEVAGQHYQIWLNGVKVNDFIGDRGREGYIGLQNHDPDSKVHFRNVQVTPLNGAGAAESLADLVAISDQRAPLRVLMITATQGWRHADAIQASKQVMKELERTTELRVDTTEDLSVLTPANLAQYDVLFLANATLRNDHCDEPRNDRKRSEGEQRTCEEALALSGQGGTAAAGGTVYDVTIKAPDGDLKGQLSLTGEGANTAGNIDVAGSGAMKLESIRNVGSDLAFSFNAGEYGVVTATTKRDGTRLTGTLAVAGTTLPFEGTLHAAPAPAGSRAPRQPASTAPDKNGFVAWGYTPVNDAQRAAIRDFVRSGKGLVVAHAGLDALYGWEDYREMVGGGLFQEHPWTQAVRVDVEDHDNPADTHLGDGFYVRDEIYVLDENPRWNSHVLLSLNMPSVGVEVGHADATRDDYPISWIRPYGQGHVFVTKLGHFPDVWRNPAFLRHLVSGIRQAAGRTPADFSGHRVKETVAKDVWPDDIVADDQGNVWIAELTGRILRYDGQTKQTAVVAEMPTTDPTNIEHGVFGIEIDPNFYKGEPYVYVYRALRESFVNTLSRFTYRDGKIDLSTEKVLLRVPTEPSCCHQAGDLEWGDDGTLFISAGDTGQSSVRPEDEISEARIAAFEERNALKGHHWSRIADSERTAQDLQELRGKVLRINKDGSIPKTNPFYGKPGVRWEIYAYGLRNPYRIKWDEQTKRLYIGIVGPDENVTYDWYDVSQNGGENFGWPRATGRLFFNEWTPADIPGYVPPTWEYTYATGSRSASGGPLYRSDGPMAFPNLQGKLIVYDWSRKWIKYGDVVNGTFESDTVASMRTDNRQFRIDTERLANLKTFDVLGATSPISMDVGRDGCLYFAEFDGFWRPAANSKANVSRYCWITDNKPQP